MVRNGKRKDPWLPVRIKYDDLFLTLEFKCQKRLLCHCLLVTAVKHRYTKEIPWFYEGFLIKSWILSTDCHEVIWHGYCKSSMHVPTDVLEWIKPTEPPVAPVELWRSPVSPAREGYANWAANNNTSIFPLKTGIILEGFFLTPLLSVVSSFEQVALVQNYNYSTFSDPNPIFYLSFIQAKLSLQPERQIKLGLCFLQIYLLSDLHTERALNSKKIRPCQT